MVMDQAQLERRNAILRILRGGRVRKQDELVALLKREGYSVTQSSVSRDLRGLGVLKASEGYVLPAEDPEPAAGNFARLAEFVREVRRAGASITVVKTATGAAQSVALGIDKAGWPEVVGTISGDDTVFIATENARAQGALIGRLHSVFRV
jgi:transcriptional regulator of arginine metabolism